MLPVDLVGALKAGLARDHRPEDGLLHCSSDILGSLRHSQLRLAGAPTLENELVQDIRLRTGTMWHEYLATQILQGLAVMSEIKVTKYLPEGWAGTADWLFWDWEKRCFVLGDLKTIRGEGMYYVERDGAKPEHIAQLSAYYHALKDSGMPLRRGFFVCYLPMNPDSDKRMESVEPVMIDCIPMSKDYLHGIMQEKWEKSQAYLEWFKNGEPNWAMSSYGDHNRFLNPKLEPPTPREQKTFWDRKAGIYNIKLVPSWKTKYCPYPNELCDCSEQGETKIGHYEYREGDVLYIPRKGFEGVQPQFSFEPRDFETKLSKGAIASG